ncbi:hypothetical protein TRICI_005361 [Trichomonascus ciferrii]|uniref:Anaphase-promoting complex subunit 4 WD40 domain-containing protein n=1 Tax=Trichomonascus ciferrii TaxID=44093 RepID=A0A642UZT9_9ASCO|nr:hypothetical protein TRICI_005361 [Trichomonascus ciferrii]
MSVVKKARTTGHEGAVASTTTGPATSVQLSGHGGEVLGVQFDGSGMHLATCSSDRTVFLWRVYGENENYGVLRGHKGAVLDIRWARDGRQLFSASSDLTVGTWDVETGARVRKHEGHEDMVNCVDVVRRGTELVVSGSDDGSVGVWDPRDKAAVGCFTTGYPVVGVAVDSVGATVYSSGVDATIKAWDPRQPDSPVYELPGHGESTVTSLAVASDDQTLLSHGMDGCVRTWDVRPFAAGPQRALKVYDGAPNGVEQNVLRACWSPDGTRVAAGSSDRTAVVWDTFSRKITHKLPGHAGAVNDVHFSPTDAAVFASASSDGSVILSSL